MQETIFKTDMFYLDALRDILECLVIQENYEKAAEVRDLILYEEITDPIVKENFKREVLLKYLHT